MYTVRVIKIFHENILFRIFQENIHEISILCIFIISCPVPFVKSITSFINNLRCFISLFKIIGSTICWNSANTRIIINFIHIIIFGNTSGIKHSTRFKSCSCIFIGTSFLVLCRQMRNSVVQITGNKIPDSLFRITEQLCFRNAYCSRIINYCVNNRYTTITLY